MKAKKNPNVKVSRNSSLFFAVGLCLMLSITYSALNMKTYDKEDIAINVLDVEDLVQEEIPVVNINTPPPPPPPWEWSPFLLTIRFGILLLILQVREAVC